jgi:hypothetical protein
MTIFTEQSLAKSMTWAPPWLTILTFAQGSANNLDMIVSQQLPLPRFCFVLLLRWMKQLNYDDHLYQQLRQKRESQLIGSQIHETLGMTAHCPADRWYQDLKVHLDPTQGAPYRGSNTVL